jgi:hypothetical protein
MDSALTKGTFFGSRGWGYYISHYYTPNNFPKETPKNYTFAGLLPACCLCSNHGVHLPLVNMASKRLLISWLEPVMTLPKEPVMTLPKDQSNKPSASMRSNMRRASSSVEGTTLRMFTPFFRASLPTEKVKWNVLEICLLDNTISNVVW